VLIWHNLHSPRLRRAKTSLFSVSRILISLFPHSAFHFTARAIVTRVTSLV
jgi:hypothetical protein